MMAKLAVPPFRPYRSFKDTKGPPSPAFFTVIAGLGPPAFFSFWDRLRPNMLLMTSFWARGALAFSRVYSIRAPFGVSARKTVVFPLLLELSENPGLISRIPF